MYDKKSLIIKRMIFNSAIIDVKFRRIHNDFTQTQTEI